jgi:hypothetical protein
VNPKEDHVNPEQDQGIERLIGAAFGPDWRERLATSEWHDIETAPTGQRVLVFTSEGEVRVALYSTRQKGWRTVSGSAVRPTHWRPLPEPPR